MKKFLSAILALSMLFSICVLPAQAADVETPEAETIEPRAVIGSYNIPADQCQSMYDAMKDYDSWTDDVVVAISTALNPIVGGAASVGSFFRQLSFRATKTALKRGADSGKGCTMFFYDNAAPTIVANN